MIIQSISHGRLFGTSAEFREQLAVAALMFLMAAAYELVTSVFVPGFVLNLYEFVGTWAGLVCVWLSRTRNILCWPWGIVGAAAFGIFFAQIGLPGQQWLNLGYFLVIQLWAWPHWAFGGANRTELSVTVMSWAGRLAAFLAIVAGTSAIYFAIEYFAPGAQFPLLDSVVVASSVVAQYLLGRKKVESWVLWLGPVNLGSIVLFVLAGAYTATALYVAFFVHAAIALRTWTRAQSVPAYV